MATRAMPTHNGPPPKSSNPPNQTLYITTLPSRSRTLTKHDLRLSLYTLFSTHGPVLDVVALKTARMRGQAHVVFRDIRDATAALRAENGREFFGAELKVEYARGKSDVLRRLDGTFMMKGKESKEGQGQSTSLQQAIFGAPPGSQLPKPLAGGPSSLPPIPPPSQVAAKADGKAEEAVSRGTSEGAQGVKRQREESDNEDDEGAPMEEESDDDVEMEQESEESD